MPAAVYRTLRGGPHHGLKLKFWSTPNAFRYLNESELGIYAPDAVYGLVRKRQKNRTIIVYEYVEDAEQWNEDRKRTAGTERLERLRRQILDNCD